MRPEPVQVLISEERLQARVSELAHDLNRDYAEADQLVCIAVLKGSVFFLVDLVRQLDIEVVIDFFQTSSYGAGTAPGEVRIKKDIDVSIRDKHVLLIEDIVDTGYTLRTILDLLHFRGARSVKLCTLLDKSAAREVDVPIDYCGFEIDDRFVVGYGLDVGERYRQLPYVGIYEDDAETASRSQEES